MEEDTQESSSQAVVVPSTSSSLYEINQTKIIEVLESYIFAEGITPQLRAERAEEVVSSINGQIESNLIALGYTLYFIRHWFETTDGMLYTRHMGDASTFTDWCIQRSQWISASRVTEAIRQFEIWTKLRKYDINSATLIDHPISPVKAAILKTKMTEFEKKERALVATYRGKDPGALTEKIEQAAVEYRVVLNDILEQDESILIAQRDEKQGKTKEIDIYLSEIEWDREQSKVLFRVMLPVDPASEHTLAELMRILHNQWKAKFHEHAELIKTREKMRRGLLDVADRVESEMISDSDSDEEDDDTDDEEDWEDEEDEDL
jgi:hypothetical protein